MTLSRRNPGDIGAACLVFGGLWTILVRHLAGHWEANPQYSYGWLVPFLFAFLMLYRWRHRPIPSTPCFPRLAAAILGIAALAFLPTWILEQPNPDWRLVSWALAIEVVVLSFATLYLIGGKNWIRHFAFPLVFFLTAVPWPFGLEWAVVQHLTGIVVAITIDALNLVGIGAIQHGNIIQVSQGLLGVDDACSGIRSLQSTFMASLFVGELFRFDSPRRLLLVIAGALLALTCNVGRAFLLAWIASREGLASVSEWHDSAGFTILTICFLGLWIIALWLKERRVPHPGRSVQKDAPQFPIRLPQALLWSLAAWLVVVLAGTEIWYRLHERREIVTWSFHWPETRSSFSDEPFSKRAAELLQFDEGRAARWHETDGSERAAFLLKWLPRPSRAQSLARSHRPEICLAASGFKLLSSIGMVDLAVGDLTIPFEQFVFEKNGQLVHVFFCVWQDGSSERTKFGSSHPWSRAAGLEFALLGQRNTAQQVLEYAIFCSATSKTAETIFRRELPALIAPAR